jgi:hypothetical protein
MSVVVRRWGRWFVVERPGSAPSPTTLGDLLARFEEPTERPEVPTTPLDPGDAVAPVWGLAGSLTRRGVVTEDAGGRPFVMGADELRILDALTGSTAVGDLLERAGVPGAALERLVAAGKVVHGAAATEERWARESVRSRLGTERPNATVIAGAVHPGDAGGPGRTPVYALWHQAHGPQLGIGMVTAAARAHDGGALTGSFEIRRPELLESIREDIVRRPGPAVLLLSDFLWTIEDNLRAATELVTLEPRLLVVHGGPSTPSYELEVERFFADHGPVAQILVRGEGEVAIGEVLAAVAGGVMDAERLARVAGIAFVDPGSGKVVITPDRPRISVLDDLPSPYLTGEFDHLVLRENPIPMALETNRGCPYGCTFCDWGSATNSRIRWFSAERVTAEIDWLASRGVESVFVTDANFGIHSRDVDTARHLVTARASTGALGQVIWQPAKNTTKHLVQILQILQGGGIVSDLGIALQTTDEATLEAIGRSNISTERLMELAREMRRQSIPLRADLMLGLPGQTRSTYRTDLQLMFDQEMAPRTWVTLGLPNAPMNEPGYKSRFAISFDEHGAVVETSTCSPRDREMMVRLRRIFMAADVYGTLRHPLRWLQWDHGLPATDVMDEVSEVTLADPDRYPALTWLVECFDLHPMPPVGWRSFYDEVRSFIVDRYGIDRDDPALECVLQVQRALMPWPGRVFPATVELAHDYVGYYLDGISPLYGLGRTATGITSLAERGPGVLVVAGDPTCLGIRGMDLVGNPRDDRQGSSYNIVGSAANELDSPLLRLLPEVLHRFERQRIDDLTAERTARAPLSS